MFNFEWDLVLMSLVIFVPSIFALVLIVIPKGQEDLMRWLTLLGTAITLLLSIVMFIDYRAYVADFYRNETEASLLSARAEKADKALAEADAKAVNDHDWVARRPWIQVTDTAPGGAKRIRFGIDYYLGADGISLPLVLLTTVLSFLAMIASWNIDRFVRGYCMLFLILETGMIGTFLSLD